MQEFAISIVAFAFVIGIMIVVHEFGHFATAKLFGVQVEGDMPDTIEKMAAKYIAAVRLAQPRAPYLLGGWSMGGVAAYETAPDAPTLPLFCYSAVGWEDERFFVPAVRIEQDIRQECGGFDDNRVQNGVQQMLNAYPHNRLVAHLANNCALTYHCPAARNYFMGRWECPIPSSPACNANCIGCISFQPEEETIVSTQDRLRFKPTAEEIVEYTVPHLETAPFPISGARPSNSRSARRGAGRSEKRVA